MRRQAYKQRCEQPDVLSRWMIEQAAELAEKPLPPARSHLGDAHADMFVINDLSDVALELSDSVDRAVVAGRGTFATTVRRVGRFGEIWCNYLAYVERLGNV